MTWCSKYGKPSQHDQGGSGCFDEPISFQTSSCFGKLQCNLSAISTLKNDAMTLIGSGYCSEIQYIGECHFGNQKSGCYSDVVVLQRW